MRKRFIAVITIVTIALGSMVFIAFSSNATDKIDVEKAIRIGEIVQQYNKSLKGKSLSKGDSFTIYEKDVEKMKSINRLFNKQQSNKEVLNDLIMTQLLLKEADKRGISVSLEEAKKYSLKEKDLIYNKSTKETKQIFLAYIRSLGISEQEYWNEYNISECQKMLTIAALKNLIVKDKLQGEKLSTNANERIDKKNSIIEAFKKSLRATSKVEILDAQYK